MSALMTPWWRQRRVVLGVAAVLCLAVVAWAKWRPVAADVVPVARQALTRTLQFTARVKTPARVEVGATVTGRVQRVLVKEGDWVQAGAPLLQLESDEWRANWLQAQGNLQQAQARVQGQQALSWPSAKAALAQAEANLQVAERDLARVQDLVASQFYSQARLDEARRNVDVARAQRDVARSQVAANGATGSEQQAAVAQLEAAKAAVDVARSRLDQAVIRAPGAGQVLTRMVEPGQIVQPGKGLLSLSVTGPTELVAPVDERYLGQLIAGQRARVVADAYPQQAFQARVDRLSPTVNAQSGSVEVTFVVDGPRPNFLREDMTLSVEVVTGQKSDVVAVPLRAVKDIVLGPQGEQGVVMVLDGGRARARSVTLGLRSLSHVEVTQGLKDADVILLDPTLAEGTRLHARRLSAQALSAAPVGLSKDGAAGMSSTFAR